MCSILSFYSFLSIFQYILQSIFLSVFLHNFLSISHSSLLSIFFIHFCYTPCYPSFYLYIQTLETVQITENPALIYIHPGAVSFVPNLLQLNLSHNGLSVLEDLQPFVPSMRILYLTGRYLIYLSTVYLSVYYLQWNLSHNGLSVLEDLQPFVPSMRILYLTGSYLIYLSTVYLYIYYLQLNLSHNGLSVLEDLHPLKRNKMKESINFICIFE